MGKELNPNKGESELEEDLNLDEEDSEDEELEFLDEDEQSEEESEDESEDEGDEESSKKALEIFNEELRKRGLNKNYKSWDEVSKSENAKDAAFAQKKVPMEKEKEEVVVEEQHQQQPVQPNNMSERLLRLENPDSVYVIEQIKRDHPGKDVLEVFESSEYYKQEAAVRGDQERAKARISNPSGGVEGQQKTVVDKLEQEFMDESTLPPGFKFLPTKKK